MLWVTVPSNETITVFVILRIDGEIPGFDKGIGVLTKGSFESSPSFFLDILSNLQADYTVECIFSHSLCLFPSDLMFIVYFSYQRSI